ncbi:MAG TPA: hypothetical protein VLZ50_02635, partial [Terracidiphilus sp.]|nr:hypothetical protein [Terracidiphilus sp.]
PFSTGSGKSTALPLTLNLNPPQGTCTLSALTITGTTTCPNNAANFGSVTGTIGGNRAITMGVHVTF